MALSVKSRLLTGLFVLGFLGFTNCSSSENCNLVCDEIIDATAERDAENSCQCGESDASFDAGKRIDESAVTRDSSIDSHMLDEASDEIIDTSADRSITDDTVDADGCPATDSSAEDIDEQRKDASTETATEASSTPRQVAGAIQKGPFVRGTSVTLQELDDTLAPTGRTFIFETIDDLGRFNIPSYVTSTYAEIIASGYYYDEIRGELSTNQLMLRTISDLSTSATININILTSLSASRVRALVAQGSTYAEARAQAENEVLQALDFSLSANTAFDQMDVSLAGEANALLLAASISFETLGYLRDPKSPVAVLSQVMATFGNDIASDGIYDDDATASYLRCIVPGEIDPTAIRNNMEAYYQARGVEVTVPDFAEFLVVPESCCRPDTKCCSGDNVQTCDKNGRWQDTSECSGDRPFCKDARCTARCISGANRCGGLAEQTCDASGRWQDTGSCFWGTLDEIEIGGANDFLSEHGLAVDAMGNVLAVWKRNEEVRASWFAPDSGWQAAQTINPIEVDSSGTPSVAVAPSGDATVVWPISGDVLARRYHPGTGWEDVESMQTDGEQQADMARVVYAGDVTIAVFAYRTAGIVTSSRRDPASGWTSEERLNPETIFYGWDNYFPLQIAGNTSGHAMAVWGNYGFHWSDIYACRYTPETGWQEPMLIGNGLDRTGLAVAMDDAGNSVVVWMTTNTESFCPSGACGIWTNRYRIGTGWGVSQRIYDGWSFDDSEDLTFAMDFEGNAFAAWKQIYELDGSFIIRGSRYLAGQHWTEVEDIITGSVSNSAPRIAVDTNGYATLVFQAYPPSLAEIRVSRFTNEIGWQNETARAIPSSGWETMPKLVADSQGIISVIWPEYHTDSGNYWTISALRFGY
ncbi:MAG: hypothetical protein JXA30_08995 [Deltaproteobacteria bacterium]|nr:hypothetical protein [Deltaproteobacteria bacterium]